MTRAIQTRGLAKSFGSKQVLAGVDVTVEAGTVFALLGANGAGKTTLINILTTLIKPDAGRASVAGSDVVSEADAVRRRISLTGQYPAVDASLTGEENLRLMGRLSGLGRTGARARARQLLERFQLEADGRRRVKTYSGGMRRRLDLAVSLVVPPAVLFLDEPTTGLDTRSRQELWEDIRSLKDDGTTVLLTTQYLEEADQLADRVAVLHGGRIVAEGTPGELKSRAGTEVVELRNTAGDLLREVATDGSLLSLRDAVDQLALEFQLGRVILRTPTLDDVFLKLTASMAAVAPSPSETAPSPSETAPALEKGRS
jgi:ABC-2 type transport system ATP-binding protein